MAAPGRREVALAQGWISLGLEAGAFAEPQNRFASGNENSS
jgi:hypothetical protein